MACTAADGYLPEKESEKMTEREITKLASDLYDEGLRAADREKIAEKTDLSSGLLPAAGTSGALTGL